VTLQWLEDERFRGFIRFDGKRSGHSGGRAIWQLEDAQDLKVCWLVSQDETRRSRKAGLSTPLKSTTVGRRPFANRIDGKKGDE
jgi:hypothetical protein